MKPRYWRAWRWLAAVGWLGLAGIAGLSAQEEEASLPGAPTVLIVHPADPNRVYASFSGFGLFKSTDGGRRWSSQNANLPGRRVKGLSAHPLQPDDLLLLEGRLGIFRSLDGGGSWRRVGLGLQAPPGEVRQLVADPVVPELVYVPSRRGLFRSFNRGELFERVPGWSRDALRVVFSPHRPGRVYLVDGVASFFLSDDFGESWSGVGRILAVRGETSAEAAPAVRDVLFDPIRPQVVYAATAIGVVSSVDGGATFGRTDLDVEAWDLAIDPAGALLAATDAGLFRRPAPGASWVQVSRFAGRAIAVDPLALGAFLLADRDGEVVASFDGGQSLWRSLRAARPSPASLGQPHEIETPSPERRRLRLAEPADPDEPVTALAVHPEDPRIVYAASPHGVVRSGDFGLTWERADAGLELSDVRALAIDPRSPRRMYAGTHGAGLFRSDDAGRGWFPSRKGLDVAAVRAVAIDPLVPENVYAGGRGGLFVSVDGGSSFRSLAASDSAEVRTLLSPAADPLELVAGLDDGRMVSWQVAVDARGPSTGRIGLEEGGGDPEETRFAVDAEALEIRDVAVDPEDPSVVYAATVYGVWQSLDGGRAFAPLDLAMNATAVAVDPGDPSILYVGTSRGLLRRGEDGWSRLPVPDLPRDATVHSLAVARVAPRTVIYAGFDRGVVAVSQDSGASFTVTRLRPPVEPVRRLGFAAKSSPLPAPDDELDRRLGEIFAATPKTAVRRRAHLLLQRLARRDDADLRDDLGVLLGEISFLQRQRGGEGVHDVLPSPDGRWLLADRRFDDGSTSHSEMRLYDLEGVRLRPKGPVIYDADAVLRQRFASRRGVAWPPWRALADVAREPEHLHPTWLLEDPGEFFAWSPDGTYLATRPEARRVKIWRIAAPSRGPRSYEPRSASWPEARALPLASLGTSAVAWRNDDRYLAVAGPLGLGREGWVVHLADLDAAAWKTLKPLRLGLDDKVGDLRFSRSGRWLWILSDDAAGPRALLVPRTGRFKMVFQGDGNLWRLTAESRLRRTFVDAPEAFAEIAVSSDGHYLAGRPADGEGRAMPEIRLWRLDRLGPLEKPHILEMDEEESRLRFSPDSRCIGLERSRRPSWSLAKLAVEAGWSAPRETEEEEDACRRRWVTTADGGALIAPPGADTETPPHFDVRGELVLDGWGCRSCSGVPLKVWRRGESDWETVDLPVTEKSLVRLNAERRWLVSSALRDETFEVYSPVLEIWDLSSSGPAGLRVQAGRLGLSELHRDEVERDRRGARIVFWERPPGLPPDRSPWGRIIDNACRLLGGRPTAEDWRFWGKDRPYESVCDFALAPPP